MRVWPFAEIGFPNNFYVHISDGLTSWRKIYRKRGPWRGCIRASNPALQHMDISLIIWDTFWLLMQTKGAWEHQLQPFMYRSKGTFSDIQYFCARNYYDFDIWLYVINIIYVYIYIPLCKWTSLKWLVAVSTQRSTHAQPITLRILILCFSDCFCFFVLLFTRQIHIHTYIYMLTRVLLFVYTHMKLQRNGWMVIVVTEKCRTEGYLTRNEHSLVVFNWILRDQARANTFDYQIYIYMSLRCKQTNVLYFNNNNGKQNTKQERNEYKGTPYGI